MRTQYDSEQKLSVLNQTSATVDLARATDNGKHYNNRGAVAGVEFNLPTDAQVGDHNFFDVEAAQALTIDPGSAGKILSGTSTDNTAGQKAACSTVGASVEAVCIVAAASGANIWRLRSQVGTWTVS